MIVLSLALVIAAAVALFIGLFVTTGLAFIYVAIGLCLVSLLLLWVGTRTRKGDAPTAPSQPVYGGVRSGGTAAPAARPATVARGEESEDVEDLDALTAPAGGEVVRASTARDRAAARVDRPAPESDDAVESTPVATPADDASDDETSSVQVVPPTGTSGAKKAATRKSATRKAATKKATTKKATTKKATTKKASARKSTTGKAPASRAATRGTRGAAARARLDDIPGVGPAKRDALLSHYGSLEAIRDAPVDDIVSNVKGFGEALATRVKDAL